ncbi:bifunctional riboflavin kinase/FAD synthetase [Methyloligella sp. 2.7D]|uniref:bifunctional riboflavin kinase/FAD synthetase n=1 Tax=unclassified Methyloligella TaxID=2625955 RepID=UPI00157CAFFE|nr:bifunctional riboflavin kinase/FAD synthetase [Methyloligella sp. GL2]QKP78359.1 bifunctional riboflavin kinase/FAD synthetase [Methyloligella sp. GL2]
MDVVRGWQDVPASARGAALAIGNFDGVHRGHQALLGRAEALAKASGGKSGAIIFDPHPRRFFSPDKPFFELTPVDVKLELLEEFGLDLAVVIPFDADFAGYSAERFAEEVIAGGLGASHIVVGHDFNFGKGRSGDPETLAKFGERLGFEVSVVPAVTEDGAILSSSQVRDALAKGDMRLAASTLGYWWRMRGNVESGAGRGAGLGFPTVNLPLAPGNEIAHGIYAVRVNVEGEIYSGAGYVGPRPTFGDGAPTFEAYVLDFEGDLYGKNIEIEFIEKVRDDRKFDTPEELSAQMDDDCAKIAEILAKAPATPV